MFVWLSSSRINVYGDGSYRRSSPLLYNQSSKQPDDTKSIFNFITNTKYYNEVISIIIADNSFYNKPKLSSSPKNSWFVNEEDDRASNSYNYNNNDNDVFNQKFKQQQQRNVKDFSTRDSRIGFIRKVYAIFTTQIFITICISSIILNNLYIQNFLLNHTTELLICNMISSIGTIMAFSLMPSLRYNMPWNFILLGNIIILLLLSIIIIIIIIVILIITL